MIKHIIEYHSEIKSVEQTINTTTWINVKGLRLRVNQISKCHTLVSVAFSKWQNHKDGNIENNRAENLELVSFPTDFSRAILFEY